MWITVEPLINGPFREKEFCLFQRCPLLGVFNINTKITVRILNSNTTLISCPIYQSICCCDLRKATMTPTSGKQPWLPSKKFLMPSSN